MTQTSESNGSKKKKKGGKRKMTSGVATDDDNCSQTVKHLKSHTKNEDVNLSCTDMKTLQEKKELLEISKQKEAVREKKRQKRKQKKLDKAKQKETSQSAKSDEKVEIAKTEALNYLQCWNKKRSEWTFKKIRQVWLLQHMYNQEMVTDDTFTVLLEYMDGIQGKARSTTAEQAEKLLKEIEENESEQGDSPDKAVKLKRARDIIQLLT